MKTTYIKHYLNNHRKKIPKFIFKFLSFPFYLYSKKIFKQKNRSNNIGETKKIKIKKSSRKALKKIEEIYDNSDLFDLIVMGSYADGTETKFSDVDGVVVVKNESFNNYKNFKELKKKLDKISLEYQKIDPLQHHGHWIIFEEELNNYEQSKMPLVTFENAISIGKNVEWIISESDMDLTNKEIEKILNFQINDCLYYTEKLYNKGLNFYELKTFVSSLSLMPALSYQMKGDFIRKEIAIRKIKNELGKDGLEVLNFASEVREKWNLLNTTELYKKIINLAEKRKNIDREYLEKIVKKDKNIIKIGKLPVKDKPTKEDFLKYIGFFRK
jgi:predicted nucleotidyltransferase